MSEKKLPKEVLELLNNGVLYVSINMDGDEAEERDYFNTIEFHFVDNEICDNWHHPITDVTLQDIDLKYFTKDKEITIENFARPLFEYLICNAYEEFCGELRDWERDGYPIHRYMYRANDDEILVEEIDLDISVEDLVG